MKTTKSKRLNKSVITICDFNAPVIRNNSAWGDTPTGTDPTNTTAITLTTISGPPGLAKN